MEMNRTRLSRPAFVLAAALLNIPVFAQVDLSGSWQPAPAEESLGNPDLVDYTGLPINAAARQCAPPPPISSPAMRLAAILIPVGSCSDCRK